MLLHIVEIVLYLLAIVLATYALWERFPAWTDFVRKLALAGALLTLFLTYFVTSLRIDEINKATDYLQNALHAKPEDEKIRTVRNARDDGDLLGQAVWEMMIQEVDRGWALHDHHPVLFAEAEGVRLVGMLVEKLAQTKDAKSFQISAVSTDPNEFNQNPIKGYEKSLEYAVGKMALVQRIYVLPDDWWNRGNEFLQNDTKPLDIENWMMEKGNPLHQCTSHYRNGIKFLVVPFSALITEPIEYDMILVTKGESNVILAARRTPDGRLEIFWSNSANSVQEATDNTEKWLGNFISLRDQRSRLEFPKYVPPEGTIGQHQ